MDTDRLVRTYLKMRHAKDELAREFKEKELKIKSDMEKIETFLLKFLNDNQIESSGTAHGTFFRQEEIKPSCQDWSTFHQWIAENDAFDMLQKRITTTALKAYMDDNEGALPPGVSVHREFVVRVRTK